MKLLLLLCLAALPIRAAELVDVAFISIPPGARIEIERSPAGRTPATLKLPPGEYRITLTLKEFAPWEQKISVQPGQPAVVKAELQRATGKTAPARKPESETALVSTDGQTASTKAPMTAAALDTPAPAVVAGRSAPQPELATGAASWHRVKYEVSGKGSASLTYRNTSGGTEQRIVALPWDLTFSAPAGQALYLSAQKQHPPYNRFCEEYQGGVPAFECVGYFAERANPNGPIQSVVYVDGTVMQAAESTAAYGIASVSGRVP